MSKTIFEDAYLEMLNYDQKVMESKQNRLAFLKEMYGNKTQITKQDIVDLLNIAIMDEYLAEYNYFASYNLSKTDGKADYDPEFTQHEDEEREHRKDLVNRLRELGSPVPVKLLQDYFTLNSSGQNWKQELEIESNKILMNRYYEELSAIEFYALIFKVLRSLPDEERDTTTEMLIKHIKADEEAHAKDLRDLAIEHGLMSEETMNDVEAQINDEADQEETSIPEEDEI